MLRCGIASPGVSTRYSIDSVTPDRTGPCGIVNSPYPVTCLGSGSPGLTSGASRGWPSGTIPVWSWISRSYQNAAPIAGGARVSDG